VLLAPITLLSGTAPFAPNVPSKVLSGTENTATTVPQDNIGTSPSKNVWHVQLVKFTIQSRISAYVLLKRLSCLQMEVA
jgi:hypothetical protein